MTEAVTLLTRIQKAIGSNLGRDTDYLEIFRGFLHFLQANAGTKPQPTPRSLACTSFPTKY